MLLYADLYNLRLSQSATGETLSLPDFVAGQKLRLSFRFLDVIQGNTIEKDRELTSLKASIGYIDTPPKTGQYKIKINGSAQSDGVNTTAFIDWNESPSSIETKLNALSAKVANFTIKATEGSLLILCGGNQLSISVVSNTLSPVAFGRFSVYLVDDDWVHELRLMQAPLAFTDTPERVLPEPPTITLIQDGGYLDEYTKQNEIQKLYVPADFRGTYQIVSEYKRSELLDINDGPEEIQAAIIAMLAGTGTVVVTNPTGNAAFIEFTGDLAATDVPLMTVEVYDAPPGDWTISLDLDRAEMRAAMRSLKSLDNIPLEIEGAYLIDPDDEDSGTTTFKISTTVTVTRPLIWPDMSLVQDIDFQRPPSPKDYKSYTLDQIIIGEQHYGAEIGDGSAMEFVLDHNFGTLLIASIEVIDTDTGRFLNDDEYEAEATSEDSLTLTFDDAPAIGAYRVVLTAAGPISAFQSHTHTIAQIIGLQAILDDHGSRLVDLEAILPSTGPGASSSQASGIVIKLPATEEVLFLKDPPDGLFGEEGVDPTKLKKIGPLLLPACHDASVTNAVSIPDPVGNAGSVYTNGTGAPIPLGSGYRGGTVATGGLFASDGRVLYAVTRSGTTTSYYPRGFERELWRIFIDDKMLQVNRTLDVQFGLGLQLINATSNVQWVLVIEKGTAPEQSSPATTGMNLENIVWDATPILTHRIIITQLLQTHSFGARIKRGVSSLTMDTMLYGTWSGANASAPSTPNFALRARLINFDTENALANDAKGHVAYQVIGPNGFGTEESVSEPVATIS